MKIGIACDEGQAPGEVIDLLAAAGLPAGPLRGRAGSALVAAAGTTWLLADGADVLAGCAGGALDAAVAGKDVLLENQPDVLEVLDLRVCADAIVCASGPGGGTLARARPRIATRYPRLTRRYFDAAGRQVEPVPFAAAALAPGLGLADAVVELRSRIVASGAALDVTEVVAACTARLLVGRAAHALHGEELAELIVRLRTLLEEA